MPKLCLIIAQRGSSESNTTLGHFSVVSIFVMPKAQQRKSKLFCGKWGFQSNTFTIVAVGCFRVEKLLFGHIRIFSEWNMNRSLTTATLQFTKRAGASPQQHCEIRKERKLHNINIVNYKTSKSVTTTRLGITKRAGAVPQLINRAQYERELNHSAWRLHEVRPNFTTRCPESRETRRQAASYE